MSDDPPGWHEVRALISANIMEGDPAYGLPPARVIVQLLCGGKGGRCSTPVGAVYATTKGFVVMTQHRMKPASAEAQRRRVDLDRRSAARGTARSTAVRALVTASFGDGQVLWCGCEKHQPVVLDPAALERAVLLAEANQRVERLRATGLTPLANGVLRSGHNPRRPR